MNLHYCIVKAHNYFRDLNPVSLYEGNMANPMIEPSENVSTTQPRSTPKQLVDYVSGADILAPKFNHDALEVSQEHNTLPILSPIKTVSDKTATAQTNHPIKGDGTVNVKKTIYSSFSHRRKRRPRRQKIPFGGKNTPFVNGKPRQRTYAPRQYKGRFITKETHTSGIKEEPTLSDEEHQHTSKLMESDSGECDETEASSSKRTVQRRPMTWQDDEIGDTMVKVKRRRMLSDINYNLTCRIAHDINGKKILMQYRQPNKEAKYDDTDKGGECDVGGSTYSIHGSVNSTHDKRDKVQSRTNCDMEVGDASQKLLEEDGSKDDVECLETAESIDSIEQLTKERASPDTEHGMSEKYHETEETKERKETQLDTDVLLEGCNDETVHVEAFGPCNSISEDSHKELSDDVINSDTSCSEQLTDNTRSQSTGHVVGPEARSVEQSIKDYTVDTTSYDGDVPVVNHSVDGDKEMTMLDVSIKLSPPTNLSIPVVDAEQPLDSMARDAVHVAHGSNTSMSVC